MSEPTDASKTCKQCGETKPLTDFYRDAQNTDGRRGTCITCWKGRGQARRNLDHDETLRRERQYREDHRERLRETGRESARRNATRAIEYQRQYTAELKAAVLEHYGKTCACCGTSDQLSVDHVNGDGREHRESLFGTSKAAGRVFYRWLIANGFPDGYQTLCLACNSSKRAGERCQIAHGAGHAGA